VSGRRGRRLSAEERALWRGVARSVTPLRQRANAADADADADDNRTAMPAARAMPGKSIPVRAPPPERTVPPLAPLARRDKQKLVRRRDSIDARLDLHGMTQAQAHAALARFLGRAQAEGHKFVLVVTGKGGEGARDRGVLRRQVPLWLGLPEFRRLVVGFETAHVWHGGEGALYVRVRRMQA
jgi:DNA-nicking Smr family endonuclease